MNMKKDSNFPNPSEIEKDALESLGTKSKVSNLSLNLDQEKLEELDLEIFKNTPALKILLVEDNPMNQEFFSCLASVKGWDMDIADNGQKALNYHAHTHYDLILMDIHLPILNGFETTKRIRDIERKKSKRTPIIAVSASAMEDDVIMALQSGMDDHISKPVNIDLLSKAVKKYTKI